MSEVLRAGYKLTEVGVIPEDWRVGTVKELVSKVKSGLSRRLQSYDIGIPVLTSGNIQNNRLVTDELKYWYVIDPQGANTDSYILNDGDILLCFINSLAQIGKPCIYKDIGRPVIYTTNIFRIVVLEQSLAGFVYYLLSYQAFQEKLQLIVKPAVNQASFTKADFLKIDVPFPSTNAEQRAIAAALSDIDTLLAKLDTLIAKKRNIKQAAMQQLLTGQTRLPGFSGEWEVKRVEEFGEVVTGGTPRTDVQEYWGEGFPWITPTDISIDRDMHTSERSITLSGLNSIRSLPKNTVLVTCIASIGKNAILKTEGACNQQINAVIPNHDHCVEFLYYIFEVSKQYLQANAGTSATSMVSKAVFSKMNFLVPSLPEQTAIAAVFSDMDTELAALETRRDKTQALKQGMMQELLTGKIRLV